MCSAAVSFGGSGRARPTAPSGRDFFEERANRGLHPADACERRDPLDGFGHRVRRPLAELGLQGRPVRLDGAHRRHPVELAESGHPLTAEQGHIPLAQSYSYRIRLMSSSLQVVVPGREHPGSPRRGPAPDGGRDRGAAPGLSRRGGEDPLAPAGAGHPTGQAGRAVVRGRGAARPEAGGAAGVGVAGHPPDEHRAAPVRAGAGVRVRPPGDRAEPPVAAPEGGHGADGGSAGRVRPVGRPGRGQRCWWW